MSDTKITPEERAEIRRRFEILRRGHPITGSFSLGVHTDGYLRNYAHGFEVNFIGLLNALEQAEARAEKAEANVARLQQRVNELLSEELTDGAVRERIQLRGNMHEVLQKNERLTKMVDWLASHTADICASVYQDSYDLHWWTDCEWKEAARRAVAAGEE